MSIVADIMSTDLLTFAEQTSAGETIHHLVERSFSAAPVVRDGKLIGLVSELELFDVLFDPQLKDKPVTEFMVEEVVCVEESTPLQHVAQLFALHGIRRVPVLRGGKPVGIVSRRDLLRFASRHEEPLIDPLNLFMADLAES